MTERVPGIAAAVLLAVALAGCGSGAPGPAGSQAQSHAQQEASVQVGDVLVRANAVPAASLGEAAWAEFGSATDDHRPPLLELRRVDVP